MGEFRLEVDYFRNFISISSGSRSVTEGIAGQGFLVGPLLLIYFQMDPPTEFKNQALYFKF